MQIMHLQSHPQRNSSQSPIKLSQNGKLILNSDAQNDKVEIHNREWRRR